MTAEEALAIGMDWVFEACKPEAEEVAEGEGGTEDDHYLRRHPGVTGEV